MVMDIKEESQPQTDIRHVEQTAGAVPHGHERYADNPEQLLDSQGHKSEDRHDVSTDRVTAKTWVVICILSFIYGLAWWPIPVTIIAQPYIASQLGNPEAVYWFISVFAAMIAVGYLISGANSDLYGRRMTLLVGEGGLALGLILCASAKSTVQFQAGMGIAGFFAGVCFMILCSIPELIPLKHRHLGLGIADGTGFVTVVIGPIAARVSTVNGGNIWRWLYWADVILLLVTFCLIFWLYHPPKHPRGAPWNEALRGFDWVGTILASSGLVLMLTGIIYTSYLPSNDHRVIIPLSVGFFLILVFGLWEALSKVRFKLCPPEIFKKNYGRDFTFPLIVESIISMYYFGINVIYPTMVTELWVNADTSLSEQLALTTPSNLGLCAGVAILSLCGSIFSRVIGFRWALVAAVGLMLIFGGMMTLVTPFNKPLMIAFTVLQQLFYAYSVIGSISLVLWGVHQHDLGIATGIAGTGRNVGGSLAQAIYTTILVNTQNKRAAATLPQAAIDAGLSPSNAQTLLKVWAQGTTARQNVPGVNAEILAASNLAWKWAVADGLRTVGLASLGFGLTAFLCLFACVDPEPKMTDRIEIFLENDVLAEKNEFH